MFFHSEGFTPWSQWMVARLDAFTATYISPTIAADALAFLMYSARFFAPSVSEKLSMTDASDVGEEKGPL